MACGTINQNFRKFCWLIEYGYWKPPSALSEDVMPKGLSFITPPQPVTKSRDCTLCLRPASLGWMSWDCTACEGPELGLLPWKSSPTSIARPKPRTALSHCHSSKPPLVELITVADFVDRANSQVLQGGSHMISSVHVVLAWTEWINE